jgi:ABC-type transport system involved in cytochrome bd biosynthesis fused ATPase/permease subunit
MLLDEISSSLDEPTEQELYRRLFDHYPGTTMLFITHRPTIINAARDSVTVLQLKN